MWKGLKGGVLEGLRDRRRKGEQSNYISIKMHKNFKINKFKSSVRKIEIVKKRFRKQ